MSGGQYTGGLIGLLNPFSLCVGMLAVAMFVTQGASWLIYRTQGELQARAYQGGRIAWVAFVAIWLVVTVFAWFDAPDLWANYGNPLTWIAPILFLLAAVATGRSLWGRSDRLPILCSSLSIAELVVRTDAQRDARDRADRRTPRTCLHGVCLSPLHGQA
jgi:cytochrome d ubiquinol oxidase subunit II